MSLVLMGLLCPPNLKEPASGFNVPAYRLRMHATGEPILFPEVRDDRISRFYQYKVGGRYGNPPVWSNDRFTGATHIHPDQPALYAFKFPGGVTYVSLKELMIPVLRNWLNQCAVDCADDAVDQALAFCDGQLPAHLAEQLKLLSTATKPGKIN